MSPTEVSEGTVVVHGGSRGIGLAFCRALAADSKVGRLFITCRSPAAATELQELEASKPDRVFVTSMDVTDEASVAAAATVIGSRSSEVSLLINSFGVLHEGEAMRPERRISEVNPETLLSAYAVNAVGPALVAKHFSELFPARERCVFATLSARVGSIGDNRLGGWYAYRASKAAQNMITKGLSIELGRRKKGLICVGLHPGTTATELSEPFTARRGEGEVFSATQAASQLLSVIEQLRPEDNGGFFAWNGEPIPW